MIIAKTFDNRSFWNLYDSAFSIFSIKFYRKQKQKHPHESIIWKNIMKLIYFIEFFAEALISTCFETFIFLVFFLPQLSNTTNNTFIEV